uniref:Gamma-secretase-activating protein C-terminal domain-containing protein n=2 Tax=Photinus pyralis TaxID=7054 RepID=A0A1Y1MZ75_PHOPY
MVIVDNIASKLCAILQTKNSEVRATEWRLLGQEQSGLLLLSWTQTESDSNSTTHIGVYSYEENTLQDIYKFEQPTTVIQASLNSNKSVLGFVTKEYKDTDDHTSYTYQPFILKLDEGNLIDLQLKRTKQIMIQFLYRKQSVLNEKKIDKFLIMIHEECVLQYQLQWDVFEMKGCETLVRVFLWAQWDSVHQTLYYIHYKTVARGLVEDEDDPKPNYEKKTSPTLSGLQFHEDLPHETVLNIPLNLPHLNSISSTCNLYEDDTVPLRIHNCSLDLMVLTDSEGFICVCHNYLYQPVQTTTNLEENDCTPVHFAYSVTVLHQSCVIHCVIPGIPWNQAKTIRPTFMLYEDHHILVYIPGICTQLLDVGILHEPTCHITIPSEPLDVEPQQIIFVPALKMGKATVLNITSLEVIDLTVTIPQLLQTFKNNTTLENKLSIMHYLLVHRNDMEAAMELFTSQIDTLIFGGLPQLIKEFLIGSSYSTVRRNLPSDASQLINLLPITTQPTGCDIEIKINDNVISLSQDALWNASMMLLSPQQRLVPYRADIWTKLWDHLIKSAKLKQKFKPAQVVEKLLVSLVCYQPEALSRSSTPLSPGSALGSSSTISDLSSMSQCSRKSQIDALPFYEIESCTASKQEHVISVNLRELSMHLLKQSTENKISRFQWQSQTPMHVHAVATRYVAAQLEQSRFLCHILSKAIGFDPKYDQEKGFVYIDHLPNEKKYVFFAILERYYSAVESIAFPLPQGFTSFFTFLGYRTLRFNTFLQYVQRNVFELQVDVMKIIMMDTDDTKAGIQRKLKLLSLLPRSRLKRLLSQWSHPVSLMIRAREHALNILSGVEGQNPRLHGLQKNRNYQLGLAAFPSEDRLSPLDTFLDLLTAKANLTEIDFGLLIEATITSTDEFI